jgi:hypothetical protein
VRQRELEQRFEALKSVGTSHRTGVCPFRSLRARLSNAREGRDVDRSLDWGEILLPYALESRFQRGDVV